VKVNLDIKQAEIHRSVLHTFTMFCHPGVQFTQVSDDAQLVVTTDIKSALTHLKDDKLVALWVMPRDFSKTSGLASSPSFSGKVRVFSALQIIPLYAWINQLAQQERS
jgi:hypothetical protein